MSETDRGLPPIDVEAMQLCRGYHATEDIMARRQAQKDQERLIPEDIDLRPNEEVVLDQAA